MTPAKALELVERYSRLHAAIRGCAPRIGEHLELCHGQKGFRKEEWSVSIGANYVALPTERASQDQETHLPLWYSPEVVEETQYTEGGLRYRDIGPKEHVECPHCYAAHLVIQERKALKRQFAAVKGAMTRAVPHTTKEPA